MSFRAILSALLIGFILFIVVVALGMKFNWVSYFSPGASDNAVHSSRIESESVQNISNAHQQAQVSNYQLINEKNHLSIADSSIKDQCIRSSRQAGVTNAHIHEAVRQCIELTQRKRDQAGLEIKPTQTDMDMTREACEIVASEEKGLSRDEQQAMILQCIQANSN